VNAGWEFDDSFFEKAQLFGGYADYKHTEFEGPGEVGTVFENEGFEVRAEIIQAARGSWRAAHGVQLRERDFSAVGEEAFVTPSLTQQIAGFTFHQVELGNIHLEGSARYENTKQENDTLDINRNFDLFSVSGGGDIHINDALRIGGTVFRTERAPTTEELFSNGPHLATNQFEIGDVNLDKETATGAEAAIRFKGGNNSITLNAFYTDYSDYIYEIETARIRGRIRSP